MNLLYTISRYWPAIGGAETHVRQIAAALSEQHNVWVIAHTNRQQIDPVAICSSGAKQTDHYEDGTVHVQLLGATAIERLQLLPVRRLYHYPGTKPIGYRLYASVFAKKLITFVQEHQIDVIHNILVGTEYLSRVSCQVAHEQGIPFVITPLAHEGIWGDGPSFFEIYRQADAVIALLKVERALYVQGGVLDSRLHTIGVSPVIADTYDPVYFCKENELTKPIIVFIGRQVESKGYPALLRAAPMVWRKHPNASFVFIGPKEKSSSAPDHPPDRRILHLGAVSDFEKTSAIAACDLLCLPSNSEIMPTVILEAWSFGKPVIGGTIPALQELIQEAGGGVVAPQEPAALAQAITELLDDKEKALAMGTAGRQAVLSRYTRYRVAEQLEQVYQQLCDPVKRG